MMPIVRIKFSSEYDKKLQDFANKIAAVEGVSIGHSSPLKNNSYNFVNVSRINELRTLTNIQFDLSKLIRYCEELNLAYSNQCYLTAIMLVRSIINHIPPIFGFKTFSEVANQYKGSKSFKESALHLENSSRKIADSYLHNTIRNKEVLPNNTQIDFTNDLDFLLSEVVRIL